MKDKDKIASALLLAAMLGAENDKKTEAPKINGDKIRKQSEDLGNGYFHVYLGFKDAGFTDDQAFALLLETIRRN